MPVVGVFLILLGVLAGIMPFVGEWAGLAVNGQIYATEGQLLRHGVPAAAIVIGGLFILPPVRPFRVVGGLLALAGGGWLLVGPTALMGLTGDLTRTETAWALGSFYVTGALVTFLAGLTLGIIGGTWFGERRAARRAQTAEEVRAAREEERRAMEAELEEHAGEEPAEREQPAPSEPAADEPDQDPQASGEREPDNAWAVDPRSEKARSEG
jgi:hypothetical protein